MNGNPTLLSIQGALVGSAVGDALGVPFETADRSILRLSPITDMVDGGYHEQPLGAWSDDTSMTLCTADSLIGHGPDYSDQMQRYADWLWNADYTSHGVVFDVGGATKQAIFRFVKGTPALDCGETAENTCGNGSLMRIMPTALYLIGRYGSRTLNDSTAGIIHDTSRCTHAHLRCRMACGIFCCVVFHLFAAQEKQQAIKEGIADALDYYREKPEFSAVCRDFAFLTDIGLWKEEDVRSSGYVVDTLQAALWCFYHSENYRHCVLRAVNLGNDTDTTAAVAGGLAGMWYGLADIPASWREKLAKCQQIERLGALFHRAWFETPKGPIPHHSDFTV